MRRVLPLPVLGLIGLLVGPLAADQVVLKDGRTLDTKKPPVIKGRQAVLTLADGKLVSIPASEIDSEKTAALAKKAAEAAAKPAPAPTPVRAPTLAEAARASQNAKKATVVLTDQDVAGGYLEVSSGSPEKGEGEVSIGPVTTKKGETGWSIEGSVMNSGKAPVVGVTVTIEALGEKGKSVASAFAALAKDVLEPGEKASFRAQVDTTQAVERFTYLPRWKVVAPPKGEDETAADASAGTGEGKGEKKGEEDGGEGAAPPPPPAPTPQPTPPPPPPGWAAPQANAPVGAPSQPGGTYLPPPSSNQPKPPGGGR